MTSRPNSVAKRYAEALLDMVEKKKSLKAAEKDFQALWSMIDGSSDLKYTLISPAINKSDKKSAVLAVAKKAGLQDITYNFLGVLADNNRLDLLQDILNEIAKAVRARRGEVDVFVETAHPLSKAQEKALTEQVISAIGKNAAMHMSVNQELIGGIVVTMGSTRIDASAKTKLEKLHRQINEKIG